MLPFGGADFAWRVVDGSAFRDAPDTRTYTYAENRDGLLEVVTPSRQAAGDLRDVFQAPERNYSRLDDDLEDYGFDIKLPLMIGSVDVSLNCGAGYYERTRKSEDRLFRFDPPRHRQRECHRRCGPGVGHRPDHPT